MPVTAAVFTVGALAVIGVPPTCGFFSKWYLLLGAIQANQWGFVLALGLCTLINIALFFRIIDRGLFTQAHDRKVQVMQSPGTQKSEAPMIMLVPAIVTALVIVLIGISNQFIINEVLDLAILL